MARQHVGHRDIAQFAQDKVNLPKAKASGYRAQARRLRERLDSYLSEHPDFTLKRFFCRAAWQRALPYVLSTTSIWPVTSVAQILRMM